MYGDLSKEIKDVAKALIDKAVAEKVSEKAGDAAYKQLELNAQLIKAKKNLANAEENYLKAARSSSGAGVEPALLAIDRAKAGLQGVRDRIIQNQKELSTLQNILNKTTKSEISQKGNEAEMKAAAAAEKARLAELKRAQAEREREAEKQRKKDLEEQAKYNQSVLDGQNELAALSAFAKSEEYNSQKQQRQQSLDEATAQIQAHEDFLANVGKTEADKKAAQDQASYSARLAQLKTFLDQKLITQQEYDALVFEAAKNTNAVLKQFDADVYALVTGSISDTFGQLGTVIGEALATGGNVLNSMGSALLQGLGKFISEMGGLLIQYGTMAVIKGKLDTAIAVGGPVAIAAGLGAIAVGVALKAIGGAIAAKAKGGSGAAVGGSGASGQRGSVSTGADISSPTSSVSSGGTFNNSGGTVVFEIAGQKLIGVLNNTTQGNLRLGGSGLAG
jgi:chemotaxis protein histidine kinase CheA